MSRSIKDSNEDIDVKPVSGRRTRSLVSSVAVDSPLRRSSRIKPAARQNESSPESPLSDASNISNTQSSRVRKRRTAVMDNLTAADNSRTLRSSRRFTRAGSEVKTPPTRIRPTRASSMEPESSVELPSTPIRMKRRTSMLPLEATVPEEKEEITKVPVVTLDRNLPNVKETNETDLENSINLRQTSKSAVSEDKVDISRNNIDEKTAEDSTCVKEAHNNAAENLPSNTFEDVKTDIPVDSKKTISNNENLGKDESFSTNTATQAESSADNTSQMFLQSTNEDTSKELGLKVEYLLSTSIKEKGEDVSNKENQATNVISDSQTKESATCNMLLQSSKPLSISNINTSKLIKETCKSSTETSSPAKCSYSKELSEVTDNAVMCMKEHTNNNDVPNDSAANTNISTGEEDADSSDNMQKLIMTSDTESLSESPNKSISLVEVRSSSCLDGSIKLIECTVKVNRLDDDQTIKMHNKKTNLIEKVCSVDECDKNTNVKMDVQISHTEEDTIIIKKIEKDDASQITSTDDKHATKEETDRANMPKHVKETAEIKQEAESVSKPSDALLITNQSIIISEDVTTSHDLQDTEKTNNLSVVVSTESFQDTRTSSENSSSINKNEGGVTDMVKSTQSSTVTETPTKAIQEVPEKGELLKKTSVLDDSSTSTKQCVDKLQPNNKQKESEENQENMEVDDNDSDTNTANLFQDIPADEWKEKNTDADKDSVHSLSTERLENESETDCDLVLVDREAWLAAENIKAEKEKEVFDYDSDDTVLLKTRRDYLKTQHADKVTINALEDESKMNVSKNKSLNASAKQNPTQQKETEDEENVATNTEDAAKDIKHVDVTQDIKETKDTGKVNKRKSKTHEIDESSTPECRILTQTSVGEDSLSVLQKNETKKNIYKLDTDSSLNKSKLCEDVPKKRKSLNKSVQEIDDKLEKSISSESAKKKKSLNTSKVKVNKVTKDESDNENEIPSAKKDEKNQSLNNSSKKRVKPKQLDKSLIEDSDDESKESEIIKCKKSSTKKTLYKNYSTTVKSDSDISRSNIDSEDSQNENMKLPKFLFEGESNSNSDNENESNESIDSDIRREYNLHGEEISEFPDDHVPGDECRASETESSDPDDNGSDLIGFVVDDDEDVEENEEDEQEDDEDKEENEEKEESEEEREENEKAKKIKDEEELDVEEDTEEDKKEDEEAVQEQDEEMQVEQELDGTEEETEEKVIQEEELNEDEQEYIKKVNKPLDNFKNKNKLRKSMNSSLPLSMESNKKEKKKPAGHVSLTEKSEKTHSLPSTPLLDSVKMRKMKQKRVWNELTDDIEQSLNESISDKNVQKINKLEKCSTPRISSKWEKFDVSMGTLDTSLETTRNKLIPETYEVVEDTYTNKEEVEDTILKIGSSSKKLSKVKSKENNANRSLSFEVTEVVEKTSVSKPISSKVAGLNKTTLAPYSESPTVTHLRRERLNDSAPKLTLSNNSTKLKKGTKNEQSELKQTEKENVEVKESDVEMTEKVDDPLKRKVLKVADNILECDQEKKRKKRKQSTVKKVNLVQFIEDNLGKNTDSPITKEEQKQTVFINVTDKNAEQEEVPVDKKKKNKKKKKTIHVTVEEPIQEELHENFTESKLKSNDKPVCNERKQKKKKERKIEDEVEGQEHIKKKSKTEKENVTISEEVPTKKLIKKKKQKSLKDTVSQNEEVPVEKLSKKKQELSKDTVLQQEEISVNKLPKKKKKLSKNINPQGEEISTEKLSKKKQKLLPENVSKNKEKFATVANKSSLYSSDAVSDADEGPEVVAFSKARNEALEMIKHTADIARANKEMKKKKQREHIERIQKEKEMKIQKLKSKNQIKTSGETEIQKKGIKRLSDEILENLSDVPCKSSKNKKLVKFDERVLPSRESKTKSAKNIHVEDDFTPNSYGSTTEFSIVSLQKIKKKRKVSEVVSFRNKMLARNSRQPVSAYLMYLEKQKASGKDKFCNKP